MAEKNRKKPIPSGTGKKRQNNARHNAILKDKKAKADAVETGDHTLEADLNAMSPEETELTTKEIRAVQLRMSGLTFHEIAKALSYSHASAASKAVRRALQRWGWNTVDEYRQLELNRLDVMTSRIWAQALGRPERKDDKGNTVEDAVPPDLDAMGAVMRLMERRSRLLGLDAPQALDIGITAEVDKGRDVVDDYEKWLSILAETAPEAIAPKTGFDDEGGIVPNDVILNDIQDAEVVEDSSEDSGDEE